MLEVTGLESGYGEMQILWGVNLKVEKGKITVVLGPNGAGKTTLARTIFGIAKPWGGKIMLGGQDITSIQPHKKVELGLNLTPEGRRLFPGMTVRENLTMGAYTRKAGYKAKESMEIVYNLFPILKERLEQRAGTLSGGQQQMLAIARTLMSRPEVIVLDEPSQGLAPILAEEVVTTLNKLRHETGLTILLIEQNAHVALEYADYGYIMEQGKIMFESSKDEILNSTEITRAYLGV